MSLISSKLDLDAENTWPEDPNSVSVSVGLNAKELADIRAKNEAEGVEAPKDVQDFTGQIDGGGIKNSMFTNYLEKPPMELVPAALIRACARAMGYGANKYAANNWRRGMRWGEVYGALLRHLTAWNAGEDIDAEENGGSGLNHLDHAAACLAFLTHMVNDERYKEMDDRP